MNTLENICRKKLGISKRIQIPNLYSFINMHGGGDKRILPLVNFIGTDFPCKITNFEKVKSGMQYKVLLYRWLLGCYGRYYILFCEREDGKYLKIYSNSKLNREIDVCKYTRIENGGDMFVFNPKAYIVKFVPGTMEYYAAKNISYRSVIIIK